MIVNEYIREVQTKKARGNRTRVSFQIKYVVIIDKSTIIFMQDAGNNVMSSHKLRVLVSTILFVRKIVNNFVFVAVRM